jgi:hypothetical protein
MKFIRLLFLSVLLINSSFIFCQKDRYTGTKLSDPVYFENKIKYIYDEELFSSMDLNKPGLEKVKEYTESLDFQRAYEEWGKYWAAKSKPQFYMTYDKIFTTFDEEETNIRNNPERQSQILKDAEKVMNHEIKGWGDVTIKFGPIVDFNANYGHSGKYGFHYWYWSLCLIEAYIMTKDLKYAKCFDELFNQWYTQRYRVSYYYDNFDNIYYDLGLGTRIRPFISNYYNNNILRDWLTHERMLKTMLGAGRWLFEQASYAYRDGNSQALGVATLALIGLTFPEFKESKEWVEMGIFRIYEHVKKDFFEDGAHSERSPYSYAVMTYGQIRNLVFMLDHFNYNSNLKEPIRQLLSRSIDWWVSILAPNGDIPAINDGYRTKCPTDLLEDGVKNYGNTNAKGVLNSIFGIEKYKDSPMPPFTSINLPYSWFAIMRTDWSRNALYMNINYGKWTQGHTHPDLLDFEVYAYGKTLAIDPAIGRTYDDTLTYKWYRSSQAHNMVVVNDSNMERLNAEGENAFWASMKNIDYFTAEHNGYKKFGVTHKREVLFVKPYYWIVFDHILSDGRNNKITWNIHTLDKLEHTSDGYFKSIADKGLVVFPLEKSPYELKKGMGMVKNEKKPDDQQELQWLQLIKIIQNTKEDQFTVMLLPYEKLNKDIKFEKMGNGNLKVSTGEFTDEIYFMNKNAKNENFDTDARAVWIRKSKGEIKNACMIDGRYLKYETKDQFRSDIKKNYEK